MDAPAAQASRPKSRAPRSKKKKEEGKADAQLRNEVLQVPAAAAPSAQVHASMCTLAGNNSDEESVIVRLQVNTNGALNCVATPYDAIETTAFSSIPMDVPVPDCTSAASQHAMPLNALFGRPVPATEQLPPAPSAQQPILAKQSPQTKPATVVRLLAEFGEKSKSGEWPSSTSVYCHWCCHPFDTVPFGMPVKYANGQFHVIGCFCSVECACSNIFASPRDSIDECLNRYSLLNSLAKACGLGPEPVRPAPEKQTLAIFGGHLDIEQFRMYGKPPTTDAASASSRHAVTRRIVVNCPPMQSLTQQTEEVNDTDLSSEYRYIPIDSDRVSRYQEKIRLMRTKPLINFKNTLDHSMKLKYTEKA